ncbi:MAG: helix-turn-helix transcriptional regulator [Clostridia bacterium]|nr:helix-turn-helix transcriptional regulator [Clostridia bacterium]
MSIDYRSIGARIKELRKARGITQERLAETVQVETSTISHIERATTKVSLPTLIHIANALEVSVDALLYGTLIRSEHISVRIIDDLLADCSSDELHAIIDMIKTTKKILRRK